MSYLENIKSPQDLKKLKLKELDILASEIRNFLINSISKTGGHLASNLGVVELTIAMHYCFNSPRDKFIWDVGHQAYTHKILTGRMNGFSSLRKYGGLSGFPKSEESPYDAFNTGHSSTSISAAIGLAEARDLLGEDYNVVSVIGDGSMTGGLVYEAMNNVGRNNTKLLIILNDNQMSISKNVGAMSKYLSELRTAPKYLAAKSGIYSFFDGIPIVGGAVNNILEKAKEGIKYALVPNIMFEQLGIKYIGPIDGHDLDKLINVINKVKVMNQPILLHVITKKGKGYKQAEKNPCAFHGVSSFNVKTGQALKAKVKETYSDIFGQTMVKLANKNKKLIAITAAMPSGTGLEFFSKLYPERIFDVGIAEEHAVTFSAGLAKSGFIPVFAVYSTFLQRSYDQIVHDVCLQKLHVVFAIDRAGIVGADGETHQGIYDLSFLSHIPNLVLLAPKNKEELEDMLDYAVNRQKNPIAIRYPKGNVSSNIKSLDKKVSDFSFDIIKQGKEIAVISVGVMADTACKTAEMLEKDGYCPSVIDPRFISPISPELINELKNKYKYIFTIEDNIVSGGFGSKLCQNLIQNKIYNKVIYNFAFPNAFIEQGSREELLKKYKLDSENIYKIIKKILEQS